MTTLPKSIPEKQQNLCSKFAQRSQDLGPSFQIGVILISCNKYIYFLKFLG